MSDNFFLRRKVLFTYPAIDMQISWSHSIRKKLVLRLLWLFFKIRRHFTIKGSILSTLNFINDKPTVCLCLYTITCVHNYLCALLLVLLHTCFCTIACVHNCLFTQLLVLLHNCLLAHFLTHGTMFHIWLLLLTKGIFSHAISLALYEAAPSFSSTKKVATKVSFWQEVKN